MKFPLRQTGQSLPLLLFSGSKQELHGDVMELTLFLQQLLLICFHFCGKVAIFAWLFHIGYIFAFPDVQYGRRKPTAGCFKQNRLLQFTRAVWLAPSDC